MDRCQLFIALLGAVKEEILLVTPELEGLAADRIGDLEIADLFFDLDKAEIFEHAKDGDDEGADKKAEDYFFLKRHDLPRCCRNSLE